MTMDRRTGSGIRIIARPAKLAGLLVLFGTLVSVIGGVGGASAADNSQPHRSKGSVTIVVKGLPKHTRSNVIMVGPRGRSQKPLRRELHVLEKKTLKRLPIGRYKLIVKKATVKRDFQTTRAGATVLPIHRVTNVKVRSGKRAKAVVVYGTIVNPGLKRIAGSPLTVTGNPAHPTAIVLPGRIRFPKNAILAMPPSSVAPYGVLSHVVSWHLLANRTKVRVRPATIYEALPNAVFASPLKLTPTSSSESRKAVSDDILDGVGCGDTGWVKPAVSISNAEATGAWATTEIGFHTAFGFVGHEFTTGLEINFGLTLGASIEAELKDPSCSITAGGFQFTAVAAGLPITGGFSPNVSVSTANELKLKMGMKMPVTMRFRGGIDVELKPEIPVYLEPDLSVGEVELEGPELDKSLNPWPIEAGVGIGLNFGIGAAIGGSPDLQASVTGNMDSGFVASLSTERCGLDAELGSFYAAGRLGPAEIRTPSTPPLLHKELVDYPKDLCGWGEAGPTGETGPTGTTGPTGEDIDPPDSDPDWNKWNLVMSAPVRPDGQEPYIEWSRMGSGTAYIGYLGLYPDPSCGIQVFFGSLICPAPEAFVPPLAGRVSSNGDVWQPFQYSLSGGRVYKNRRLVFEDSTIPYDLAVSPLADGSADVVWSDIDDETEDFQLKWRRIKASGEVIAEPTRTASGFVESQDICSSDSETVMTDLGSDNDHYRISRAGQNGWTEILTDTPGDPTGISCTGYQGGVILEASFLAPYADRTRKVKVRFFKLPDGSTSPEYLSGVTVGDVSDYPGVLGLYGFDSFSDQDSTPKLWLVTRSGYSPERDYAVYRSDNLGKRWTGPFALEVPPGASSSSIFYDDNFGITPDERLALLGEGEDEEMNLWAFGRPAN